MLTLGIYTVDQYVRARGKRHLSGASASYGLLKIGDNPTEQKISRFEDISLIFCASKGTRRTTCPFRNWRSLAVQPLWGWGLGENIFIGIAVCVVNRERIRDKFEPGQ